MEKIPDFTKWELCRDAFTDWWLSGASPRSQRFDEASIMASAPIGDPVKGGRDMDSMMNLYDKHLEHLGWMAEWLPDAEDFLQQGFALASEVVLASHADEGWNVQKRLIEGKVHGYQRVVRALERLSATINHRCEGLRTMISAEKERWKNEMGPPRQGG